LLLSVPTIDLYDGAIVNTFSSFLDMGGYAAFIWPGFGLSALVLIGAAVISVRSLRAARATLRQLEEDVP
jgi:heme exporter protein D